jgi:uncharacterized protein (UPF0297 family)
MNGNTLYGEESLRIRNSVRKNSNVENDLHYIYEALCERGYDPIKQIIGFLLSEDPTYITNHKNARIVASRLDRDEVLTFLLKNHFNI